MQYTRQDDRYIIRFEDEEAFPARFLEFLASQSIVAASFTGIGAMRRSTIAYFDTDRKEYLDIEVDEQVEVLSLTGNVAIHEGELLVHAHIILGRRDGSTVGGHLRHGIVCPTLEVALHTLAQPLQRAVDPKYGLPALDLNHRF
jgi:predicted DNA-binding protein with PD1-like motif